MGQGLRPWRDSEAELRWWEQDGDGEQAIPGWENQEEKQSAGVIQLQSQEGAA